MDFLSALWRQQSLERQIPLAQAKGARVSPKTGRNDPCPCGSGLKYKRCCLGK
ncbi:MAG: SEC-C metal-binding domain-containing protein [Thermodesulfobacteriota bacterium]